MHLVVYFHSCITMHGFMNVKIFGDFSGKKVTLMRQAVQYIGNSTKIKFVLYLFI